MSGNVVSDVLVQHDLESVMSDLHHILSVARKGQVSVLGSSKVGCKGYPKRNPLWVDLLSSARNHSANFSAAKKQKMLCSLSWRPLAFAAKVSENPGLPQYLRMKVGPQRFHQLLLVAPS